MKINGDAKKTTLLLNQVTFQKKRENIYAHKAYNIIKLKQQRLQIKIGSLFLMAFILKNHSKHKHWR